VPSRSALSCYQSWARSGEPSFNAPEKWFLALFFGEFVGLAYMLVVRIIGWLHGLTFERDEYR
jgi:hypothetical protein